MTEHRRYITSAIVFTVVALGGHTLAAYYGLYIRFSQLDTFFHILGGMTLGIVWRWRGGREIVPHSAAIFALVGFVLSCGLIWELFEFLTWTFFQTFALSFKLYSPLASDVILDLCADAIGGIGGYFLSNKLSR